jgi:hypothetical protein
MNSKSVSFIATPSPAGAADLVSAPKPATLAEAWPNSELPEADGNWEVDAACATRLDSLDVFRSF